MLLKLSNSQPLYLKTPMRDHNERKIQIQWKNIVIQKEPILKCVQ